MCPSSPCTSLPSPCCRTSPSSFSSARSGSHVDSFALRYHIVSKMRKNNRTFVSAIVSRFSWVLVCTIVCSNLLCTITSCPLRDIAPSRDHRERSSKSVQIGTSATTTRVLRYFCLLLLFTALRVDVPPPELAHRGSRHDPRRRRTTSMLSGKRQAFGSDSQL